MVPSLLLGRLGPLGAAYVTRSLALFALLGILATSARADDAPPGAPPPAAKPAPAPTTEQAADAVLAAWNAKDAPALKALAAKDIPDPWLVADELLARGEADAADAFGKAAPRKDVESLPAYVASRRGKPDDTGARKALADADAALARGDAKAALDALGAAAGEEGTVVAVRIAFARGMAQRQAVRLEDSASSYSVAARAAERMGWLWRASLSLDEAGHSSLTGGSFRESLSTFEQRLRIEVARGSRRGVGQALGNIGVAHKGLGEFAKALEFYERSLKEKEAVGDRRGASRTLGNIGVVLEMLGEYAKALEVHERALTEKQALGDRAGVALTLGNLGVVHEALGNHARALEFQDRAFEEHEGLGDLAGCARALVNLGIVHRALGNHARALEFYGRALESKETLGDRAGVALVLGNIGNVHATLGNYALALGFMGRALKGSEDLGDRAGVIRMLGSIANVQASVGNYEKALEVYGRLRRESTAIGDRAGAAATMANEGIVHHMLGDYAKALDCQERALAELEVLGDRAGATRTRGNLGSVHHSLGDHERALAFYRRALEEQDALGDRLGYATTLGNIGGAYHALGDYAKALDAYERCLKSKEAIGDRTGSLDTLANLGAMHAALGAHAKAMEILERTMKARAAIGDRSGAASSLASIGNVHASLGNFARALECYEGARREREALGDREGTAVTLRNLARVHEQMGEPAKALEAARHGALLLSTLVSGLGDAQGARAREQHGPLFDLGVRAAFATRDVAQAGFFVEHGRAGSLLESFSSRAALQSGLLPPGLRIAEAEARAKEAVAVRTYRSSLDAADLQATRAFRAQMESTQEAMGAVIERIQREAKRAASVLYPAATSLDAIQSTLASEEAMVLYALTDTQALALVVTAKEARIVALPSPTAAVEVLSAAFDPADARADPEGAAAALRKAVVEPLGLGEQVRRVLVSPDGVLSYMPFAMLLGDRDVAYVPSGTVYGLLRDEKDLRGEGILGLGDPDYATRVDERAIEVVRGGARLARLPGTRDEVDAIGTVKLLGAEASEAGLRDVVSKRPRWRSVHFACHGLIDRERPAFSSLALTPTGEDDGFLTCLEVFRTKIPADLVVLSACETGKGKVVRGEGIFGLTRAFMFAGAPRVVVSLWKVDDEATRALMTKFYALWNPKDGTPGLAAAAALRAAQAHVRDVEVESVDEAASQAAGLEVRRKTRPWAHPYYWAAWVLWGLPD